LASTAIGASQPNTITVNATRDVILNEGGGAGARIGTSSNFATPAGGNITVNAGNSIQLNGTAQPTAIRTSDNVTPERSVDQRGVERPHRCWRPQYHFERQYQP
jgi:hypothetical protein